ncbi:MAG: class I SAM-dependent methyltransferase [Deltaproteobacteria bacterium]|nr:class I SAM-dependent methyltransferase [Deltaproteobacteria bacterium]
MKPWFKYERIPGVLASSYEKASRMVIDGYYSQVADEIVSNIRQGTMLDLGTGPGYLPIEIVKRAPEIHITGVDLSRNLIHMARHNARKAGLSHQLTFEVGNSARLRFDDGIFDMVISTGMLHSLKNPVDVLTQINRVLKKDADAWIYDPANVIRYINKSKWKSSLDLRERFFLWIFGLLGLHKPIAVYKKSDVIPLIEAAGFNKYKIDEREKEIRIKLTKE